MTHKKKVLLTGAFGNVGGHTVEALCQKGYEVTALDVHSKHNDKRQAGLEASYTFETVWADLTDKKRVAEIIATLSPDAIVHVAAIIAPTAYVIPEKAEAVNVGGTRNLIEAAKSLNTPPRFIFTSSYSVHGPRNPYRDLPRLTGDTPVNPQDNYGCHKVICERMLKASGLPWSIIRLPAVWSTDSDFGRAPEFLKFVYMLPPERKEHAIDARDVAAALTNAVEADCVERTFDIGGGEGWNLTASEFMAMTYEARGVPSPPIEAFRMADPEVDESWYFEDWVDATESQAVLDYQNHTLDEYYGDIRVSGFTRLMMKALSKTIAKKMLEPSLYYGKPRVPDPTPMRKVIAEGFGLDLSLSECPEDSK